MPTRHRTLTTVGLALALLGCDRDEAPTTATPPAATTATTTPPAATAPRPEVPAEAKEARAIVAKFADHLKRELTAGLAKGGPDAIEICHTRAPEIARELTAGGWTVARTSLKLRNQDNAPDDWERSVLEALDKQRQTGADPASLERWEVVEVDGERTFRYMKAIPTQPMCLTCHGQPSGEIAAAIDRHYPKDAARGHTPGDLRGAFTLEKKL